MVKTNCAVTMGSYEDDGYSGQGTNCDTDRGTIPEVGWQRKQVVSGYVASSKEDARCDCVPCLGPACNRRMPLTELADHMGSECWKIFQG